MSYKQFYDGGFYDKGTGTTTPVSAEFLNNLERFLSRMPEVATGATSTSVSCAPGVTDIRVDFGRTFKSVPMVTPSFRTGSTNGLFGQCSLAVVNNSVTTTGCTLRVYNAGSSTFAPYIQWVATEQLGG